MQEAKDGSVSSNPNPDTLKDDTCSKNLIKVEKDQIPEDNEIIFDIKRETKLFVLFNGTKGYKSKIIDLYCLKLHLNRLETFIKENKLEENIKLLIAYGIALGARDMLESQDIIKERIDLKLENIFIDENFYPKIIIINELDQIFSESAISETSFINTYGILVYELFVGPYSAQTQLSMPENIDPNIRELILSCMSSNHISFSVIIEIIETAINSEEMFEILNNFIEYISQNDNQSSKIEKVDSERLFNLGVKCAREKDYSKAFYYYSLAAEQNVGEAQSNLGLLYKLGQGTEQNYSKSMYYTKLAAEKNIRAAQFNIGCKYYEGKGVEQNYEIAFEYFIQAAEHGFPNAQHNLGFMYKNGLGVEKDYLKAFRYFSLAAEKNIPISQYYVGQMYYIGIGVEQDLEKAFHYYSLAAEQNNDAAQCDLGIMFNNGVFVKQDYSKAFFFYSLAAEQNNPAAQYNLGTMYYLGEGVKKDFGMAIYYFSLASDQNHSIAQFNLGLMYFKGEGVMKDYSMAFHYYYLAAKQNYGDAIFNLGNMYFRGLGVEKDYEKGLHYYRLARSRNKRYDIQILYGEEFT